MKKLWMFVIVCCILGNLIASEWDTDETAEFEKYRIEAEKGDIEAIYYAGVYYILGRGVKMDLSQGYSMISEAAEKGFPAAQNWMGDFSADIYSEAEMAKAVAWWNKAARQGDPNAQFSLGQCYEQGSGVPQDMKTAVYWYQLAADQNVSDAKFALSSCYLEGKGVKKNVKEAYFWILLCFPDSWDESYDSIEVIARQLKPAAIKKVKARAMKWMDAHREER
jgi:hypothetical protein